jgi:hypothetical protein
MIAAPEASPNQLRNPMNIRWGWSGFCDPAMGRGSNNGSIANQLVMMSSSERFHTTLLCPMYSGHLKNGSH